MTTEPAAAGAARRLPPTPSAQPAMYRLIWRWHFYAGLLCIPFVLWLATTGTIYLFHPQIDGWFDQAYDHVPTQHMPRPVSEQVRAALAVRPGAVLNAYQLPAYPGAAAQILVGKGNALWRIYVDPDDARVLHQVLEDHRFTRLIFHLHGELMLGSYGSMLVELAACWTIVMLLSGLYLWWPRGRRLAGIVYPRLGAHGRLFWRDLHAVTGLWVSVLALALIVTGLPWAKVWGGSLKEVRQWASHQAVAQDWTTGRASELAQRRAMNTPSADSHADMPDMPGMAGMSMPAMHQAAHGVSAATIDYTALDRLLPTVQALDLAGPVLLTPPSAMSAHWAARSDSPNRPQRVNLVLDPASGKLLKRTDFAQHPLLDRVIGYGVAAHEGQLFGVANQILGVFTTSGLILLSCSGVVLWWRRRPSGVLGAPGAAAGKRRYPAVLVLVMLVLAVYLPMLAISMLLVWLLERWVLARIPAASHWLGLAAR